jgi:ketosteroid isomerase-like protein
MQELTHDFTTFLQERDEAARAYVRGDPGPLGDVVAGASQATFFGPRGGIRQGAQDVWSTYERGAGAFSPGGDSKLEVLDRGESDDIAYWVGLQRARVRLRGDSVLTPIDLRVTEIFRREGDGWKLVHRHADQLVGPTDDG